ncbi:efflux RND transporter periplasmic adaptor subunit [Rhodobacter lacus]|uniref:Efflux RND transporter periplasmic adaptor subunit n=1 Tax=Rhodobacter lacus TaxID=1641972 RepID=A0ABW5ABX1_9RHOB
MKLFVVTLVALAGLLPQLALAESGYRVVPTMVTDWKTVYGQIEAKDQIPARARLGGTLVELSVSEGDMVTAGQELGRVVDAKIAFQLDALDAQIAALESQMANAARELTRGEELRTRGVITVQQLDTLRTQAEVVGQQLAAQKASRQVTEQQASEGVVLAPVAGRVLEVPVAKGAVVMAGESVATVAGGGFYLRLSVPERFAGALQQDAPIAIDTAGRSVEGRLAKIYPLIAGGRVEADVEVADLNSEFVGARVLVKLPLAMREAVLIPAEMVRTRSGLDFVNVSGPGGTVERAVVPGPVEVIEGKPMVEILSGLTGGEEVVAHVE